MNATNIGTLYQTVVPFVQLTAKPLQNISMVELESKTYIASKIAVFSAAVIVIYIWCIIVMDATKNAFMCIVVHHWPYWRLRMKFGCVNFASQMQRIDNQTNIIVNLREDCGDMLRSSKKGWIVLRLRQYAQVKDWKSCEISSGKTTMSTWHDLKNRSVSDMPTTVIS